MVSSDQQIADLNIEPLIPHVTYKINIFITRFSYGYCIPPALELHKDDIFQNQVDAARIAAINRLTDTVVGNIVFFVGGKQLFVLQILSLYLIKQIGIHAVFDIIQHSFR